MRRQRGPNRGCAASCMGLGFTLWLNHGPACLLGWPAHQPAHRLPRNALPGHLLPCIGMASLCQLVSAGARKVQCKRGKTITVCSAHFSALAQCPCIGANAVALTQRHCVNAKGSLGLCCLLELKCQRRRHFF